MGEIHPPYLWDSPKQSYVFEWIPNPDYPKTSLDEFKKIARLEDEVIDKWLVLVYIGDNPEGYRCPENIKRSEWYPEPNCWREASREEVEFLNEKLLTAEYRVVQTLLTKEIVLPKGEIYEGGKPYATVELEYSLIYYFPEEKVIMKKYHEDRATW